MRGANFRDESRPIFVSQAVLWPNYAGQVVLRSDHGSGKYIALTTPRFFFVFQMVDKGLLLPVLPLLDEAELGSDVMAKFRRPCGTTGDPLEGKDLAL